MNIKINAWKACAVILAGGKSSRMGLDKTKLQIGGKSMLEHLIDMYAQGFEKIYVSYASEKTAQTGKALTLIDRYCEIGPLGGLHSALEAVESEAVFVTAVDIPLGCMELAQKLVDMRGDYDACVIKRDNGFIEPTFAVYATQSADVLSDYLNAGNRKTNGFIKRINTRFITERDLPGFDLDRILMNINKPEDYQRLLRLMD